MNTLDQSSNRIPYYTDWHRYDSATVLRRHSRGFLERFWKLGWPAKTPATLSNTELHRLVESYGGQCLTTNDHLLLVFDDPHWTRRCDNQLVKPGQSTQRWGCHIQLHESW
jgi:hypothetical protein